MGKMTYGLELETVGLTGEEIGVAIDGIDESVYAGHFGYHGSRVLGLRHARMDGSEILWVTERDGSLHCSQTGKTAEIVSPILYGREGLAHAARIMRAVTRAGGKVNKTCGTHLTMMMRDTSARFKRMGTNAQSRCAWMLVEIYDYFNIAFQGLVSPSRRYNGYCYRPYKNLATDGLEDMQTFGQGSKARCAENLARYGTQRGQVNLTNFATNGLVEFRMHNGTLNPHKITTWALLHHQMMSFVCNNYSFEDFRNFTPDLEGLMEMLNVGSDLKRDLLARRAEVGMIDTPTLGNPRTHRDYEMLQAHRGFY